MNNRFTNYRRPYFSLKTVPFFLFFSIVTQALEPRNVLLRWTQISGASHYEVEISRDRKLEETLQKLTVQETQVLIKLAPGTYYYRVRAMHTLGFPGDWSPITSTAVNPFPPKPLKPEDRTIHDQNLNTAVAFSWTAGLPGTKYVLKISTLENQKAIVLEKTLEEPFFEWKNPKSGQYQWNIGYLDQTTVRKSSRLEIIGKKRPERRWTCKVKSFESLSLMNQPDKDGQIDGLTWTPSSCEFKVNSNSNLPELWMTMEGHFSTKNQKLRIYQSETQSEISLSSDGHFSVSIPIPRGLSHYDFETSQKSREIIRIDPNRLKAAFDASERKVEVTQSTKKPGPTKTRMFYPSLSHTTYQYQQTNIPSFTQNSMSAKLSIKFSLGSSPWHADLTTYYSLFKLNSSRPGVNLNSFGISPRLGYKIPWLNDPWKLSLMAGGYYTSSNGKESDLGYTLYGLQLYPTASYAIRNDYSISSYIKLTPFNGLDRSQGSLLRNSEIAFGLGLNISSTGEHLLSYSADFSLLRGHLTDSRSVELRTFSFGIGYSI